MSSQEVLCGITYFHRSRLLPRAQGVYQEHHLDCSSSSPVGRTDNLPQRSLCYSDTVTHRATTVKFATCGFTTLCLEFLVLPRRSTRLPCRTRMSDRRLGEQFSLMLRSLIGCDYPKSEDSVHYADFARRLKHCCLITAYRRPPFLPHGRWGFCYRASTCAYIASISSWKRSAVMFT